MNRDMHSLKLGTVWSVLVDLRPRVQAGDEDAACEFAKLLSPLARAFFRHRGRPPADAEDLTVTAITEIVLNLGKFKGSNLQGWVYQILGNMLADQFRHRVQTVTLDDGDLNRRVAELDRNGVLDEAGHAALDQHLAALSEAEQRVLLLRHGREALPYAELGLELGIRPGTARARYSRAREKLEVFLRKDPRIQATLSRRQHKQS